MEIMKEYDYDMTQCEDQIATVTINGFNLWNIFEDETGRKSVDHFEYYDKFVVLDFISDYHEKMVMTQI